MNTQQVDYNRVVGARGGRKWVNQKGIIVGRSNDRVQLHSVNAKDGRQTTDLRLEIPLESVEDVINALRQFK